MTGEVVVLRSRIRDPVDRDSSRRCAERSCRRACALALSFCVKSVVSREVKWVMRMMSGTEAGDGEEEGLVAAGEGVSVFCGGNIGSGSGSGSGAGSNDGEEWLSDSVGGWGCSPDGGGDAGAMVEGGGDDNGDEENGSSSSLSRTSDFRASGCGSGLMRSGGSCVIGSCEEKGAG